MEKFKLVSEYSPMGDQPSAIQQLVEGIEAGKKGTGSTWRNWNGKNFYCF